MFVSDNRNEATIVKALIAEVVVVMRLERLDRLVFDGQFDVVIDGVFDGMFHRLAYFVDDRVETVLVVRLVFYNAFSPVRLYEGVTAWKSIFVVGIVFNSFLL